MDKKSNVIRFFPRKKTVCPACLGHGSYRVVKPGFNFIRYCSLCNGKGEIPETSNEKST